MTVNSGFGATDPRQDTIGGPNYAQQFATQVRLLHQNMGAKLAPYAETISDAGKEIVWINYTGKTRFRRRTSAHQRLDVTNQTSFVRGIQWEIFDWSQMFDETFDPISQMADPKNAVITAATYEMGRIKDSIFTRGCLAPAIQKETSGSEISNPALPLKQTVNAAVVNINADGDTAQRNAAYRAQLKPGLPTGANPAKTGLNPAKIVVAFDLLTRGEVMAPPVMAVDSSGISDCKLYIETTNGDFGQMSMLASMQTDYGHMLGMNLVRVHDEAIWRTNTGEKQYPAWTPGGVICWEPMAPISRMAESTDYSFDILAYMKFIMGCNRMEEALIVDVRAAGTSAFEGFEATANTAKFDLGL